MARSKTAVVTGAAGGVGSATVALFAREGWNVIAVDARGAEDNGASHRTVKADMSAPADVATLFEELERREGTLDALINNAAIQICKSIVETTPEEWDFVLANNVRSAYLTIRAAYPLMREHGGAIVNVASVHAQATSPNIAAYAASKGAIVALTRAAALEFASAGIRVNAVLPGAVDTPMLRAGLARGSGPLTSADRLRVLSERTPLGRIGQPAEIAQVISFLCDGDRSSFLTGEALVADGGALAGLRTE